jgi:hypothetical protein
MECGLQLPWRKHYSALDFLTSRAFIGTQWPVIEEKGTGRTDK